MERVTFTLCVLIILTSRLHQGVVAGKPRMITPSKAEHCILEGRELRIECEGEGTIRFSSQELEGIKQSKNITYVNRDHRAVFIRKNTITEDTGWYACAEEGTEIRNDEKTIDHPDENIAWTYVYVENPEKPFAVMTNYEYVTVPVYGSGVIPCRTTSPHLDVTLIYNDGAEVPPGWTYDPKIGFHKKAVSITDAGIYECVITGDEQADHPSYTLSVLDIDVELTKPVINTDALPDIMIWGKNMTLTCSIELLTAESRLELDWRTPSSVPAARLRFDKTTSVDPSDPESLKRIQITNLTVFNVAQNDGGKYTCTARDLLSGKSTENHIDITIRDPSTPYLNVSSDNRKFSVEVYEGITVQWKVTIVAYPGPLKWEWFDPSGIKILDPAMNDKGIYGHTQSESDHLFSIKTVDARHNGNYDLKLSMGNKSVSVLLKLAVKGRPHLEIKKITPTYGPEQPTNFTCTAKGSPLPTINWTFIEYPDFPSTEKNESRSVSVKHNKKYKYWSVTSEVEVVVRAEGLLMCTACSNGTCASANISTSITDPNGSFYLTGPHLAAQGDNVTLKCSVSLDEYEANLKWQSPSSGSNDLLPEDGKSKIETVTDDKDNKKFSILRLLNVTLSDRGTYSCIAYRKRSGGQLKSKSHDLDVVEASIPEITETVYMNGSKIDIESNQSLTLTCHAEGAPYRKMTWYKNGQELVDGPQYSFTNGNASLQIQYFLPTDSGKYLCRAENRVGRSEKFMEIVVEGIPQSSNVTSISVICTLIVIIIIVITYMGFKVRREKQRRKGLFDAGLTHFKEGAIESLNPDLTVDDQAELLPYDQKWEFPRENLKLGKQLGSGAFGVVMKAEARGICVEGEVTTVAVKMVRRTAEPSYMKALASELKIMIHLGRHINVVNLLGACTKTILTKRELFVIVEYCHFGNLHHYLQHHRNNFIDQIDPATQKINPNIGLELLGARSSVVSLQNRSIYDTALSNPASPSIKSSYSNNSVENGIYHPGSDYKGEVSMYPDGGILSNNSSQPGWRSNYRGDYKNHNLKPICTQDLLCWAWQVSRGMEYLSSRKVLHGDLAARNILLAEDNIVKICDFGLAKNMYKDGNYKKKGDTPLPIKWMAIESIRDRIFSTQSDVWSFGIVLWEFFTLARIPYPGMEAERQYDKLMEGHRLEKPEYATDEIYNFMMDCWRAEPTMRPSFTELAHKLGTLLNERVKTRYFDLNTPYANMNAEALQNGQNDYLIMMSSPNHVYCNTPKPDVDPASGYVPMNRIMKTAEAGPSSPRPKFKETHFNYPANNQKPIIDSDLENCPESVPMLGDKDFYLEPIGTHQVRANFIKHSNDRNSDPMDEGYCKLAKNPDYVNANNEQKIQTVDRDDHVIEIPQENIKSPRIKDPRSIESFTNPSYVTMSNNRVK